MTKIIIFLILLGMSTVAVAKEAKVMKEIRTYMPFSSPVDPAKIITIPDMDISYALAARLVEWDASKQPKSALADRWQPIGEKTYRFTLKKDAKWSNGERLTSKDVKKSLERGIKVHPADLRSLAVMLDSIECPDDQTVDFKLKINAKDSNLPGKLTEPNFGILKADGEKIDLSVTTGAFFVKNASDKEIVLKRNPHWIEFSEGVAEQGIIRRPPDGIELQTALLQDSWPNLVETSSLISSDTLQQYTDGHYQVWNRPIDKIFLFNLSKRLWNTEGLSLLKFLNAKLNRETLVKGLGGYTLAQQIFPKGYQLSEPHLRKSNSADTKVELPAQFKKRAIEVLISPARVSNALRENITRAIKEATGIEPKFISVPLQETGKKRAAGDFDIYAGTVGLADPDPEGAMSYYLEGELPIIPSVGQNYISKLDAARKETDLQKRLQLMRNILSEAVAAGNVLPLFNLSTVGIGRKDLDFSSVPSTDESVTLSRVRFR